MPKRYVCMFRNREEEKLSNQSNHAKDRTTCHEDQGAQGLQRGSRLCSLGQDHKQIPTCLLYRLRN